MIPPGAKTNYDSVRVIQHDARPIQSVCSLAGARKAAEQLLRAVAAAALGIGSGSDPGGCPGALSTLRGVKPGRRQDRWKALLDQLETARDCLLDAQQKQRYDGRLRLKLRHEGRTPSEARPEEPPSIGAQAEIDPMAPVEFSQPPVPDQLLPHDGPPGDLRRDAVVISSKLLEIRDVPIAPVRRHPVA